LRPCTIKGTNCNYFYTIVWKDKCKDMLVHVWLILVFLHWGVEAPFHWFWILFLRNLSLSKVINFTKCVAFLGEF
jgi:hypothetical protein